MNDISKSKRKKISFQRLVNQHSGYPLSVLCDVFQWMVKTGWGYNERYGVFELLYGLSGHGAIYYNNQYGIKSSWSMFSFLRGAFVRAIVADDVSIEVKAWRKAERIHLDKYRMLALPEGRVSHRVIVDLFDFNKLPLTTQLNKFHVRANKIHYISLSPNNAGWMAILNYGYKNDIGNSSWNYNLLPERMGFANAVIAATRKMEHLTINKAIET